MGVPSRINQAYSQALPAIEAVARYVTKTIRPWCDTNGYLFSGRSKTLDSLSEKIESGRYTGWSELDDLYACTIVVPTATHESDVISFLRRAFNEVELRMRNSTRKSPEVFRFDCTRFIGKIREVSALGLVPGAEYIKFEVQIPSAFEHAWSFVTHDLVYKSSDIDWRKARLGAQLKAAVEQIELIIAGFEANLDFVAQSSFPEVEAKQRIVTRFQDLISEGIISDSLVPQSWSRFADNVYSLVRSYARSTSAVYKVDPLLDGVETYIRSTGIARDLKSGSLFQVVVGAVSAGAVQGASLKEFVVLDSPELRTFYHVTQVPKPFVFDDKHALSLPVRR